VPFLPAVGEPADDNGGCCGVDVGIVKHNERVGPAELDALFQVSAGGLADSEPALGR
jgi:hypothetical protein